MRILMLANWFPHPLDNGARIRTYNLLEALARWHEITLFSFSRQGSHPPGLDHVCSLCRELRVVPHLSFEPGRLRALVGLLQPDPRVVAATYSSQMERLVRDSLERDTFDLVIASEIGPSGGTTSYIRHLRGVPRVLEDLELSISQDRIIMQRGKVARLRLRLTWAKLRRYTMHLLQDLDGCTVASECEREAVLNIVPGYRPLAVVPNGVDLGYYSGDLGLPQPDTLVFQGALTYRANFDAMVFFLRQVFPLIRTRRPGVKLYVTGRTEGVPLKRLPQTDGVVFTGYLEDVRPRVARSMVCVVPLTVGGGTRLKILEAMALGTPVVSTSKGAEGLDVTPGKDILIADEPQAFADAVLRLLRDAGLRAWLSENGRRLVREKYDWQIIGERFNAFLEQVVAERDRCFMQ